MLTHRHATLLGDIPSDWQAKSLKSLLIGQFAGDWGEDTGEAAVQVFRSTNFTESGTLDVEDVATRYFTKEKAESFGLEKGDLLLERSGGGPDQPVGRIAFVTREHTQTTVSNFVQVLRSDPSMVDPDFLGWALYEVQRSGVVERVQQQSTQMRNLTYRDYLRILLPSPPLPEQRRIAAALRLADAAIAKAQAELDAARVLKQALMHSVFTEGMPGKHRVCTETKIGPIPCGWAIKPLGDLLVRTQYGLSEGFGETGRYAILRMNNVEDGIVNADDVRYIDVDDTTYERYRVAPGDILFNRTNSMEYVGRVGIVNEPMDAVFASYLVRLTADATQVNPWFLNFCLNSPGAKNRYRRYATPAVQQANINPRNLCKALIAYPPLQTSDEQMEILELFKAIDLQLRAGQNEVDALATVKRSLLQHLLTGRIRLPAGAVNWRDGVTVKTRLLGDAASAFAPLDDWESGRT